LNLSEDICISFCFAFKIYYCFQTRSKFYNGRVDEKKWQGRWYRVVSFGPLN